MCSDENGAPHAVRYLNAQLAVLHENAVKCLETHPQARGEDNRQYNALAEFTAQRPGAASYMPSETDSLFHACFKAPELRFVCDHDVLLHLTVEKGHVVLDTFKAGKGEVVQLQSGLCVTYRVGFETRRIVGNDTKIGDSGSVIELVILDLKNATVSSIEPEQTSGRDSLLRYLNQYLDLLYSAGNHVLFSLPHFGQDVAPMEVSFSLMAISAQYEWLATIYGVTVEHINAHMSSLWLKSAMLAYGGVASSTTDWRPRCLAEFSRKEGGDFFHIKFGAPHVNILCSREVVITFDIDEAEFFDDDDFTLAPVRTFTKWKVAMVVNVLQGTGIYDNVVRIMFDLTNGRYHHTLSAYPEFNENDEEALEYRELIIAFFAEEYLGILHGAGYHVLYEHDARWESIKKHRFESSDDTEGSWWSLELGDPSGVTSRETIQRAKMYGFDQVVAISQGSINAQFSALWASASAVLFHTWAYEQFFSCTFKALSLTLLSNNRAIVWVHLTNGNLRALRDWAPSSDAAYEFRDWRMAFEVELKMCTHEELEGASSTAFMKTMSYERHANHPDRELNHIYLNLRNAEYIHEYSTYSDLRTDVEDSRGAILKLQAVVWYLTQHYFPALCKEGMNVLSSIPIWKTAGLSLPSYALTSVAFHVYSRVEVARHNWAHVTPGQEPIVVVLGTTGYRPLPAAHLEWSTGWVVHANRGFSHGTLSIARRVFLEERLLALLSGVNAHTTLIPLMLDPLRGFYGVSLRTWAGHEQRKDRPSKWELQPAGGDGCLRYMWEHCEEWRYKMAGSGDMMNATQGMSCITRNFVELPTAVKQGALHIKVSGKVELSLALQTMNSKSYTATSSVSWSTNVTVQTAGTGIKVTTLGSHDPVFAKAEFTDGSAAKFRNPMDMLREAFPEKVALDELVQEIRAFEGAWEYCCPPAAPYSLASPVFNDDGDLLFELRRYGTGAGRAAAMSPASRIGGRSASPAFNGRRAVSRTRTGGRSPVPHSPTRSPTVGEC
ncbi:uncharacterized protein TRAVEDRAFT_121066 [Trametes versicolor FP-101664 SS1]|uniref:uncharacterized protein n=1 Tax=Trametes versicolor (strain FP-101664) TaxID=717944 RepID=UPI000462230A|nr:uncharacterized protein TRAVEDRAFT_121066 [Trametes versicolor FP-101664 SS1]EIW59593.1 hypothetical protein TRAVEDRAFT_121066 [Trametes versicolor FP-101664 SS1]